MTQTAKPLKRRLTARDKALAKEAGLTESDYLLIIDGSQPNPSHLKPMEDRLMSEALNELEAQLFRLIGEKKALRIAMYNIQARCNGWKSMVAADVQEMESVVNDIQQTVRGALDETS